MVCVNPIILRDACFAFIVKNEQANAIYNEYGLAAHNSTNNVAKYTGIIN